MKKLFLFLAVLIAGSASQTALATEIGDTLVLEKVDKVRIETRDTVQRIVINGVKDDPYFHYSQRISIPDTSAVRRKMPNLKDFNKVVIKGNDDGKTPKVEGSAHLYVGMGTMTGAPDGYSLWPAFEFGVGGTADWHPFGKKNVWSTGLLLGFRTCHVKSNRYLAKDDMGVVSFVPYDAATQKKTHSSLSIFSLQVPLLYTHYFDAKCKWMLSVGALVNFNVSTRANRYYTFNDEEYDVSTSGLGQRPVPIEPTVIFDAPYIPPLYCRYSPMTFFKDGRGPKMHQLSFGICF